MTEPASRPVQRLAKLFNVSRELTEDKQMLEMLKMDAVKGFVEDDRYLIVGEPTLEVSQPLPPFEFGVDDEGNTYRRPDAVVVRVQVVER